MRRRSISLVATSALLLALTACGGLGLSGPPSNPPVTPLPADQLVFLVDTGGGFVPPISAALQTPGLLVYGDGRVISVDQSVRPSSTSPLAYVVAQADPQAVSQFAADTLALGLIGEGTDFGTPQVTDMPVTTVLLHGAEPARSVHIYAFSEQFDDDLPRAQRQARRELSEVISRARGLTGDGATTAYQPDRVRVLELEPDAHSGGQDWPGPDPETFLAPGAGRYGAVGCGMITGPTADIVYRAARANADAGWKINGKRRVLAVVPALPESMGC